MLVRCISTNIDTLLFLANKFKNVFDSLIDRKRKHINMYVCIFKT